MDSETGDRDDEAAGTDASPAVPPWRAAIEAAADEAFDANPGGPPDAETVALIRRILYPPNR